MLTALRGFRDFVSTNLRERKRTMAMARIEVAKRYSGATLSYLWAVVKPSVFIAVYWFAISVGVRRGAPVGEAPFIAWLIPGILPWFFMSEVLTVGGSSIRNNKRLVTKMVYPVSTIPTFTVLGLYLTHIALIAVAAALFVFAGFGVTAHVVQMLYYVSCSFALALALALLLSTLTVLSRDVEHMIKSVVQVLFWMTPIIWPLSSLGAFWRHVVMLNPIVYLVEGYRNAFVYGRWFYTQWYYGLYFWAIVIAVVLFGSYLYEKTHGEFADVL